jgi:flavorubredoxin
MDTGMKKMFFITREAVASVIKPAKLRWLGFSHFEKAEAAPLNEWLTVAPQARRSALASNQEDHRDL